MPAAIRVGDLTITFLKSRHETQGALDLYELTIPAGARTFTPHLHREYDETIFGVDGITHWVLDGCHMELGPGEQLYIARGVTHTAVNLHMSPARVMCLVTPGKLGPEYFRELAAVEYEHGQPDAAALATIMARYGVIPVTP